MCPDFSFPLKKSEDLPWVGAEIMGPETITPVDEPDSQHLFSLGSVAIVGQREGSLALGEAWW